MAVRFRCFQSKWAYKQLTEVPSITSCAPFENIVFAARFERWRSTRTDHVSIASTMGYSVCDELHGETLGITLPDLSEAHSALTPHTNCRFRHRINLQS